MWKEKQQLKVIKPLKCIYADCIIEENEIIEVIKLQRKHNKIYLYKCLSGGYHLGKIPKTHVEILCLS